MIDYSPKECPNCKRLIYNGELCVCQPRDDNFKLLNETSDDQYRRQSEQNIEKSESAGVEGKPQKFRK